MTLHLHHLQTGWTSLQSWRKNCPDEAHLIANCWAMFAYKNIRNLSHGLMEEIPVKLSTTTFQSNSQQDPPGCRTDSQQILAWKPLIFNFLPKTTRKRTMVLCFVCFPLCPAFLLKTTELFVAYRSTEVRSRSPLKKVVEVTKKSQSTKRDQNHKSHFEENIADYAPEI